MPSIPDGNIFGVPAFHFTSPYTGKSTYNANHSKAEYRNVSVCMYSSDSRPGNISGVFASQNYYDFTPLAPYDSNTPYQFTYNGKTVYWYHGYKYANNSTSRDYLEPTIDYYESYEWFQQMQSVGNDRWNKVAWLMIYGDVIPDTDDPYEKDGSSDEGGGEGDFDGDSDSVDIPPLPDLSAVDTGFIALFNPSVSQLQALANYMWSSGFDLDTFKKLFADPMSCILGLSIVPVNVPSGGSSAVVVGNISTGVSMPKASRQYVEVDCGTLNVNEYWGAYLDYDPYTKAELYLPYIGTHPIAVDDIMNKSVHVVYHVDILSGACIAYVKCGESVLYSFIGQCSSSIPITGNDWTNVINGVLGIAGAVGTMVATGGASAPYAVASIASTAVNSLKPTVEKSGSLSGTGGIMGIQKPYLILTRPRQALPARQNKFIGYPSFITVDISNLTGYTEIESVHLEGIPATDSELSEIESILKSGVIF